MDLYKKNLISDEETTTAYYTKSIVKTQQQLFLESLLKEEGRIENVRIADIACGGGTLSYHLHEAYPGNSFTLVDYNQEALRLARELNKTNNFNLIEDDIYTLKNLQDQTFDKVFCWQALSWLEDPAKALDSLLRITRRGR